MLITNQDNPSPRVEDTIRWHTLGKMVCQYIGGIDIVTLRDQERELAVKTLQEILTVMQDRWLSDAECVQRIDEIFYRNLGQMTIRRFKKAKTEAQIEKEE